MLHPVICSPVIPPLVDVLHPVAWRAGGAGQTLAQRLAALGARLVWPSALTDAGVLATVLGAAPVWSDTPIVTAGGVDPSGGLPTFSVDNVDWSDSGTLRLVLTAQTASADIVGTVQVFGPLYATGTGLILDDGTNQTSVAASWASGDVLRVVTRFFDGAMRVGVV